MTLPEIFTYLAPLQDNKVDEITNYKQVIAYKKLTSSQLLELALRTST